MKSWTIAAVILPSAVLAFPQMHAKRSYYNETTPTIKYSTAHPTAYYPDPSHTSSPTSVYHSGTTPVHTPTGAPEPYECTPGKYECTYDPDHGWGWSVCDQTYSWTPAGHCESHETCLHNPMTGAPYCMPISTPTEPKKPVEQKECTPTTWGPYQCAYSAAKGWYINQCSAEGHWIEVVDCKATETCTYGAVHGYPYCRPKEQAYVCTPGAYECYFDTANNMWGWRSCTAEGTWTHSGYCHQDQTCSFNKLNGAPYCL